MRISIIPGDAGYRPLSETCNVRVFLDGVEQTRCLMADEELGLVLRYATTDDGQPILSDDGTELVREEKHGVVRIELL